MATDNISSILCKCDTLHYTQYQAEKNMSFNLTEEQETKSCILVDVVQQTVNTNSQYNLTLKTNEKRVFVSYKRPCRSLLLHLRQPDERLELPHRDRHRPSVAGLVPHGQVQLLQHPRGLEGQGRVAIRPRVGYVALQQLRTHAAIVNVKARQDLTLLKYNCVYSVSCMVG